MTVSEYIIKFLEQKGIDTAFCVTGGHTMHLNDALCKASAIHSVFVHHEQAASMSADAYSRASGKLGFALVTAGPGAMNAVNGLVGAYVDSAPILIISGQSNINQTNYMYETSIRQYGVQGIATKNMVEKATKYFATIDDPAKVAYHLEHAYYMAFEGRPGPVWLEVPLNVQAMQVPEKILRTDTHKENFMPETERRKACNNVISALSNAKRPLIMAGQGIRLAGVVEEFIELIEKFNIPVITTRLGIDLIEYTHPLFVGHPGNNGDRAANITAQNADFLLVLGSRMSVSSVGHEAKLFAKNANICIVDIDIEELNKPNANIKDRINDDLRYFIPELLKCRMASKGNEWVEFCEKLKYKYPVMQPEYKNGEKINSYYAVDMLSSLADEKAVILTDAGSVFHVTSQGWKTKKGQRFIASGGLSSMGYWCAAVGACVANDCGNTIAVTGDGSLQMNIQELATIKHLNKPLKVIVINNNGYLLIRQTQRNYMEDRFFGEGPESGVLCPDSMAIASAYGIKGVRIESSEELEAKLRDALEYDGPVVCEVMCPEWQEIVPRVSSDKLPDGTLMQRDFEDMYPYLPADELTACMIGKREKGD